MLPFLLDQRKQEVNLKQEIGDPLANRTIKSQVKRTQLCPRMERRQIFNQEDMFLIHKQIHLDSLKSRMGISQHKLLSFHHHLAKIDLLSTSNILSCPSHHKVHIQLHNLCKFSISNLMLYWLDKIQGTTFQIRTILCLRHCNLNKNAQVRIHNSRKVPYI
jgi:hypothetical protein